MPRYYKALLQEEMPNGEHPMDSKKSLARRVTARFHSGEEAAIALQDFERRFSRKDLAHSDLPFFSPASQARDLVSVVVEAYARCFGIVKSRSDARRLIEGGSVQWGGEKTVDPKIILPAGSGGVLKLDKTRAVRIP
jgi:tyrosyl-tRNA synthetase